ncbi:hypothetical protein L1049_017793 [Liquidambar formosana]|uniref:F-box domain-containing protein n=1 Tax=Liquidambar formosana TaxID=63359 RepID=A0AAP0R2Y6_LIQFO
MEERNKRTEKRAKGSLIEKNDWGLLPRDILFDILARLPVKSLIKLKYCVCKLWFNFFSDPNLVEFNFQQQASKLLIVLRKSGIDHEYFSLNFQEKRMEAKKLTCSPIQHCFRKGGSSAQASCDGLILLSGNRKDGNGSQFQLAVYNYINHTHELLPWIERLSEHNACYSLVHDPSIQKYKVVGANEKWRTSRPLFEQRLKRVSSIVEALNGVLYWIAFLGPQNYYEYEVACIQTLDIAREEFMERIELPCQPRQTFASCNLNLLVIKGSLCLTIINPASGDELDIWALKEYRFYHAWIKQHTITLSSIVHKPASLATNFSQCFLKLLFVVESCVTYIFIHLNHRLFCYNMETREQKRIAIEGEDSSSYSPECITRLVNEKKSFCWK